MGSAITDYVRFLADARDAVYRLNCDRNTTAQLADEEKHQEQELETAGRAVMDAVNQTVKKRLDEINSSYDKEITKGQERLKKAQARREKAKNKGMKERIAEEASEPREHSRELKLQMKTLFQKEQVLGFCSSAYYYALYDPRGVKEFMLFFMTILARFLAAPCGICFLLLQQRQMWYLVAVYFLDVLLFGGLYVLVGNKTRLRYQDALKRGRAIRNTLRANRKEIRMIIHTIQKDGNEDIYDLEKHDDEIARVEQELSEITTRKKDALSIFESVTRNIISDEIVASHKSHLDDLKQALEDTSLALRNLENSIKEQNIRITDTFGPYLGKEFLEPDRLPELSRIIQGGTASDITETITVYNEIKQVQQTPGTVQDLI